MALRWRQIELMRLAPVKFRLLIAALALAAGLAAAWSHTFSRHHLLRLVTEAERLATSWSSREPSQQTRTDHTFVYAHRAATTMHESGNSTGAIAAAAVEYRAVEVDLFFSADGVPFIGHGELAHLTSRQLATVRLPDGSAPLPFAAFVRQHMHAFERLLLDVKTDHTDAADRAARLAALLPRTNAEVTVLSRSGIFLLHFDRLRPDIGTACESYLAAASALAGFTSVSWARDDVNRLRDAAARKLGLERIYWTAVDERSIGLLRQWHPEHMIVNFARMGNGGA